MAETVKSILTDAFEDIVVGVDEAPLEASDARTGIRAINRIMSALASQGVNLGYTEVNSLDDDITIPDGAMDSLVSLVAYRLWPKYRTGEPSSTIALNARRALTQMAKIGVTVAPTQYPGNLPMGSGNYCDGDWDNTFYPDLQSTILTESNGSISLEDETENG